jgi:2'-5' RNA ligase
MDIRSFLAFEQPPDMKDILAQVSGVLRNSRLDVRWVKPENIHLTVLFMGNMRGEVLEAMKGPIEKLCLTYGPFRLSLKGTGCFPNARNPRILWIGLQGDLERMSLFREDLEKKLLPFGIKEEKRSFKPHLTLGRFRKFDRMNSELDDTLMRYRDLISPVGTLHELSLFRSDLKPGGPIYTRLESWSLTGDK